MSEIGDLSVRIVTIVSCDSSNGIGSVTAKLADVPWQGHLPEDCKFFNEVTSTVRTQGNKNACIMGIRTFLAADTSPKFGVDFTNLVFVIITHQKTPLPLTGPFEGVKDIIFVNPDEGNDDQVLGKAIKTVKDAHRKNLENIFLCGGESIYALEKAHRFSDLIMMTKIKKNFGCNRFFPEIDPATHQLISSNLLRLLHTETIFPSFEFNEEFESKESGLKFSIEMYHRIKIKEEE